MDYIYTTNRQSGREKNGTMYNGGGLGQKGIGADWGLQRGIEVSKSLQSV